MVRFIASVPYGDTDIGRYVTCCGTFDEEKFDLVRMNQVKLVTVSLNIECCYVPS